MLKFLKKLILESLLTGWLAVFLEAEVVIKHFLVSTRIYIVYIAYIKSLNIVQDEFSSHSDVCLYLIFSVTVPTYIGNRFYTAVYDFFWFLNKTAANQKIT